MQRGFQRQVERQDTVTHNQSLTLVRNLFRTAISSICYLRGLFPEECFSDRSVVGLNIKSLTTSNKQVVKIIGWLEDGVFDALEKRYLREVVFGLTTSPNDPKSLVESYRFDVVYPTPDKPGVLVEEVVGKDAGGIGGRCGGDVEGRGGVRGEEGGASSQTDPSKPSTTTFRMSVADDSSKPVSRACVKEATVTLLRRLMSITQMLPELPQRRYIYMGLKYTDDTPSDYEPPHFHPSDTELELETVMAIGQVRTGFHSLNLSLSLKKGSGIIGDETSASEESAEDRTPSPKRNVSKRLRRSVEVELPKPKRDNNEKMALGEKERERPKPSSKTNNIETVQSEGRDISIGECSSSDADVNRAVALSDKVINEIKKQNLTLLQLAKALKSQPDEVREVVDMLIETKTLRYYRSKLYIN